MLLSVSFPSDDPEWQRFKELCERVNQFVSEIGGGNVEIRVIRSEYYGDKAFREFFDFSYRVLHNTISKMRGLYDSDEDAILIGKERSVLENFLFPMGNRKFLLYLPPSNEIPSEEAHYLFARLLLRACKEAVTEQTIIPALLIKKNSILFDVLEENIELVKEFLHLVDIAAYEIPLDKMVTKVFSGDQEIMSVHEEKIEFYCDMLLGKKEMESLPEAKPVPIEYHRRVRGRKFRDILRKITARIRVAANLEFVRDYYEFEDLKQDIDTYSNEVKFVEDIVELWLKDHGNKLLRPLLLICNALVLDFLRSLKEEKLIVDASTEIILLPIRLANWKLNFAMIRPWSARVFSEYKEVDERNRFLRIIG